MKKLFLIIFTSFILFSQESEKIICNSCNAENKISFTYCVNCGKTLPNSILTVTNNPLALHRLDHLFSIPKAEMLKSLDVNLMLGSSFGIDQSESFLGKIGVGIGDIAQVDIGTVSLIGNMLGIAPITTIGLKGVVYNGSEKWPSMALSISSSNDWNDLSETNILSASPNDYESGLRGYNYEMRLTSLGIIFSKNVSDKASIHFGLNYIDTRYRNLSRVIYNSNNDFWPIPSSKEKKKELFGFALGFENKLNDRTYFMFEAQTIPNFNYNLSSADLVPNNINVAVAGIRFGLTKWMIVDTGVRYQSNFNGLADVQIRMSANAIFSMQR